MKNDVILKSGRDYSARQRHPWIFSGAIAHAEHTLVAGDTVRVLSHEGEPLGLGAWSPESQIRVRFWSFDPAATIDETWIAARVGRAVGARARFLADDQTNAFRLINAESDGLPGVTADFYNGYIICQFTTTGAERWKSAIVAALGTLMPCQGIYERSDADIRGREGLAEACGVLAGSPPPERIAIVEHGCRYEVDVRGGHKTGFYLDQRDSRRLVAGYANGGDVLNAFSYTGGFGIAALAAGAASVTHVDLSEPSLEQARKNTLLNSCSAESSTFIAGSVFDVLRKFRDEARTFDVVVLDPPKFADAKGAVMKAARGYKDINLLGLKLLRPGGILATFSCSGAISADLFRTIVAEAAVDAKRDVQILHRLQQGADHPEGLAFPEGLYLKGLLCRVN